MMSEAMIPFLAGVVRDEAERFVRGRCADPFSSKPRRLGGWCGVMSAALVAVYRDAGFEAEIASGYFTDGDDSDPHFWCFVKPRFEVVPAQWPAYAHLVDITATQFNTYDDRPVVHLPPGDRARNLYELEDYGDHVLEHVRDGDVIGDFMPRVEVRLQRADLLNLLEVPW